MRLYRLRGAEGARTLTRMDDQSEPQPGPGEVQVRVRAASLNPRDLGIARGRYAAFVKPDVIPLSDGAGEVTAVGAGVTRVKLGDRVTGAFLPDWIGGGLRASVRHASLGASWDGMLSQYVVLPERAALTFPDSLSFHEAATLPCAALTAWNALFETARIGPSSTVLLQGGGGVSVFALQLAKAAGATVIQTSGGGDRLERLRALGADQLIDYQQRPDWDQAALAMTGGEGVDAVVEVGGAGTLERSVRAVRMGGVVALIGFAAGPGAIDAVHRTAVGKALRLAGVQTGSHEMFAALCRTIAAHRIKPVIDQVFGFEEAAEAMDYLAAGRPFGKVVIDIP